jgi:hypothetical protein
MKASLTWNWKTALLLASLPFIVTGLHVLPIKAQDAGSPGAVATPSSDTSASTTPATTSSAGLAAAVQPSTATAPPDLQLYGGTKEVVKLAQAGVDDGVILSYITNANVRFGVSTDQIIYLNDLGVSGTVVTAMMQHDAALNAAAAANTPPPATSAPPTAPGTDNAYPPAQTVDDTGAATPPPDTTDFADYAGPNPDDGTVADDTDYFYDSLQPYGNWVYLTGYGMCWQPTVYLRDHAWRPYSDRGRWIYTDYGWYWQSDYSWGWAAFHYGRWFCDARHGWVWRPNRVWSPAWVAWRASGEYAGWAPLPPAALFIPGTGFYFRNHRVAASFDFGLSVGLYTFIPIERFVDYAPSRYSVAPWQAPAVFSESKALTGVTVQNRAVANIGLDPRQVDAAAGVNMRRAVIRQLQGTDANGRVQPDRLGMHGGSLVIYRPQLPSVPSRHAAGSSTSSMEMPGAGSFTPVAGATRPSLNASPATPARTPTVLGAAAYQPANGADAVSHVHVYYVTHQDPKPVPSLNPDADTTTVSRYAPNSMVLIGQRNLTQPQWQQVPSQGQASGTQLRYSRPGYTPNANSMESASGQIGSQYSRASYESSYRPAQGVAASPGQGMAYTAPRYDYRQSTYAPQPQEPAYREPAPEPRENYAAPAQQQRESYSAPAPQQSYSSRNQSYSQPSSSSSSSGSNQKR